MSTNLQFLAIVQNKSHFIVVIFLNMSNLYNFNDLKIPLSLFLTVKVIKAEDGSTFS